MLCFFCLSFPIELYIWSWPTQKTLNRRRKVKNFSPQKGIKLTSASVKVISGEQFMCRQPPENTNNRMFRCRSHRCFTGGRLLKLILWGSINCDTLNIGSSKHIKKKLAPKLKWKYVKKICTATPSFVLLYNANCKLCHCMQKNKADNTTAAQSILSPMCLPGPS